MNIIHELNQLDWGGVEKVIHNIIKFDGINKHSIIAYKDGDYRGELENVGAKIIFPKDEEVEIEADVVHIHSGGDISSIARDLEGRLPILETIHSPVRSPMAKELISQRVGVTEAVSRMNESCITIHNGLDLEALEPTKTKGEVKKELNIQEGLPIIGRLGRIGRDKCLEEWLLTCYRLQQEGLEFTPLIVGGEACNAPGYISKLKLMAASLPVENIIWMGHRSDIANYLQIMDIFLYPSPTEGFGLVFAEAMYCGAVVVTYKTDVTLEVAGGYAILTEQSIDGLAEGIKKALDTNFRDNIIPLAHNFVETEFPVLKMVSKYQEIYKQVA